MSTRTCNTCGSRLANGYQKLGDKPPQFIVFCSRLSFCDGYQRGQFGKGQTLDDAYTNFHNNNPPTTKPNESKGRKDNPKVSHADEATDELPVAKKALAHAQPQTEIRLSSRDAGYYPELRLGL